MPMSDHATVSRAMSDLSENENIRFRNAMRAVIGPGKRFPSITALAKALQLSQPSLSAILAGGGASIRTVKVFAKLLRVDPQEVTGGSVGAPDIAGTHRDDPYPSRIDAVVWARKAGLPESAIEEVLKRDYRTDPGSEHWMHDLLETARRHRLLASLEGRTVELPADPRPPEAVTENVSGTKKRSGRRKNVA